MSQFDCDFFVIGGGSGGIRAAKVAAKFGAKVQMAEQSRLGGTCVIRGCVPKKLFVQAGDFRRTLAKAPAYGWSIERFSFDWPSLLEAKERKIDTLERKHANALAQAGVEVIKERAHIIGDREVATSSGRQIRAKYVLIAVGGQPSIPEFPGAELGVDSDDLLELPKLPQNIIIQGGGYIACEFASLLQDMGVAVTQIYRRNRLLRGFDDDIRQFVQSRLADRGIKIITNDTIASANRAEDAICVKLASGTILETDMLMHATGRRPSSDNLGLESVGIELNQDDTIPVDEMSRTRADWLYAVGDVTGRVPLTPAAIREGENVSRSLFAGDKRKTSHTIIPTAIFTRPEVGAVGLSEQEAISQEGEIEVYSRKFQPLSIELAGNGEQMLVKLICRKKDGLVLGVHIAGDGAAEMVQLVAVAMELGASKDDLDRTLPVHPTSAEELVTL